MEIIIVGAIILFLVMYRSSSNKGVYEFFEGAVKEVYDQYAPYSYKVMHQKVKELGLEYTKKQYLIQIVVFAGLAALIGYLYFYSVIVAVVYAVIAVCFIPYITYLRCKRQYMRIINTACRM